MHAAFADDQKQKMQVDSILMQTFRLGHDRNLFRAACLHTQACLGHDLHAIWDTVWL